jgi:hypothetical protein
MTRMKVVFEESAMESPNDVMGTHRRKFAHKCTEEEGEA